MEHRFVNRNGLIHPLSSLQAFLLEPMVRSLNEPVELANITAVMASRHLSVDRGSLYVYIYRLRAVIEKNPKLPQILISVGRSRYMLRVIPK